MGMLAAYKRGTAVDLATVSISLLGCHPRLFAQGSMLFFGVYLQWLPVAGYAPMAQGLGEHLRYLALPALSLGGVVQAAYITRMTRSALLDIYIKTTSAQPGPKACGKRHPVWPGFEERSSYHPHGGGPILWQPGDRDHRHK